MLLAGTVEADQSRPRGNFRDISGPMRRKEAEHVDRHFILIKMVETNWIKRLGLLPTGWNIRRLFMS